MLVLQTHAYRSASEYMKRSSSWEFAWHFLLTAVVIVAVWALLYYWDRVSAGRVKSHQTPRDLFRELCLAHRLTVAEASLLGKVADQFCAQQPAFVFVDRRMLQQAECLPGSNAQGCAALLQKLFGPPQSGPA